MIPGAWRRYTKRLVIVHVPSGPSIQGVLVTARRDYFVLERALHLDEKKQLGGEIVVPRAPGVWIQTVVQHAQAPGPQS